MPLRLAAILAASLLLTGCSTASSYWDWFNFPGSAPAEDSAAPPPPVVAEAAPPRAPANGPDPFCLAVAQKDTEEGDFDAATKQRVATRSYNQCVALLRAPASP